MTEAQCRHQQPGYDLVADAEIEGRIESVVRERNRCGQRDGVATEQRYLHAGLPLGNTVTHRRHTAGKLSHGINLTRRLLDDFGKALQRLVRRQHIVVGRDDRDAGLAHLDKNIFIGFREGSKRVCLVGTGQRFAHRAVVDGGVNSL